jgi:tRNA-Thr(GGU) m(6)t(6)A37 methyltransferase TsaA
LQGWDGRPAGRDCEATPGNPSSGNEANAQGNRALRPDSIDTGTTMSDDEDDENAFGIREGETAVPLPDHYDASLYFIGRIRTPWRRREECPKNARQSDAVCTLVLDERWMQGLTDVETCSHLVVLYWMNRSRRDLVLQKPRHYRFPRGTFALRSPARPNPIAMSVVRLVGVDGNRLSVVGLDCLDDTPLLDLKPYFAAVVGWHAARDT